MFIIIILASFLSTTLSLESNFYAEETCTGKSGYCVLEKECPHAVDVNYKNLCKSQQSNGAICCKNFPSEEVNCNQSHNECRKSEECPNHLNIGRRGCEAGNTCCVLV